MKRIVLITHVNFWQKGAGHRSRIIQLVTSIKDYFDITVLYLGDITSNDSQKILHDFPFINFKSIDKQKMADDDLLIKTFEEKVNEEFDFAIFEYIELSVFRPYLPQKTVAILDTHDIVHERLKSFVSNDCPYSGIELNLEDEFAILDSFNLVIAISDSDATTLRSKLDHRKIIVAPHGVSFAKQNLNSTVKHIGFIASEYEPNVKALTWFLNHVWPLIYRECQLTLNIFGNVQARIEPDLKKVTGARFHGFVDDLNQVYSMLDIVVNPVTCGAGLKIKNVEALGNGLPLVTTTHSARGLQKTSHECFLIADTPDEFLNAVLRLTRNYQYRRAIGDNAFALASENFSKNNCYKEIIALA